MRPAPELLGGWNTQPQQLQGRKRKGKLISVVGSRAIWSHANIDTTRYRGSAIGKGAQKEEKKEKKKEKKKEEGQASLAGRCGYEPLTRIVFTLALALTLVFIVTRPSRPSANCYSCSLPRRPWRRPFASSSSLLLLLLFFFFFFFSSVFLLSPFPSEKPAVSFEGGRGPLRRPRKQPLEKNPQGNRSYSIAF